MKKVLSIILCLAIAFSCVSFAGCGEDKTPLPPAEKPVISLSTDEKEITTNYVKSYELPTAECKSKVDKKKLPITVTATTEAGAAVTVEDGYLLPTTLGKHIIRYNATDKDAGKTKADEKTINIIFNDNGAIVTPKSNIGAFTAISTYTNYAIPAFSDVASISYDLRDWSDADFDVAFTATFTASGATEKQPITDVTVAKRYEMGTIEVNYTLTAKTDSTITATHKLDVVVGDALFNEIKPRNDTVAIITKEEVPELKANGYVIKIASPFITSGDSTWGGAKLTAPSDILSALNESKDNALVINAYNPTPYWGRYFFSVYDDNEYTGIKGNFGNKHIFAPHEHFQMVIPKGMHLGEVNIFEITMQIDAWKGEPLASGAVQEFVGFDKKQTYHANEVYLISTEVVSEKTQPEKAAVTNIWANDAIPTTLGVYTSQHGKVAADGYTLEKFTRAASADVTALDGLKITGTGEADGYLDFMSDPQTAQTIKDKFADTRLSNYGNYFAYTVHNLTSVEQTIWVMLGYQSNAQQTDKGTQWLYDLKVPANGSREVYMNASSRNESGHRTPFEVVRLSLSKTCELILNNVRIVNYKNANGNPIEPFKMELKSEIDTTQITGTSFTVPAFDAAYTTNFPATGAITSVKYRNTAEAVGVDKAFAEPITLESGFYDITYTVTETATEKVYTKVLTIESALPFELVEKSSTEIAEFKTTTDYQTYTIPTFDTVFNCITPHTAVVTKVEFKSDAANSTYADITSDATKVSVKDRVGSYKITYTATQTSDSATKTAEFIVTSNSIVQTMFSFDTTATKTNITEGGKHSIKVDNTKAWGAGIYDSSSAIYNDFKNATDDSMLVIKGKNLGEKNRLVFYQDSFKGQGFLTYWVAKDEEFNISLPRKFCENFDKIKIAFAADGGGSIEITDVSIIKEADIAKINLYDLSTENGAATATAFQSSTCPGKNNKATVTFNPNATTTLPGSLTIASPDDSYINLIQSGADKINIESKLFAKSAASNWFAVDITNSTAAEIPIWVGLGYGGNDVESSGHMREQLIPANSTKTVYVSREIVNSTTTEANKDNALDTLWIDAYQSTLTYSNFRILNVANIA